METKRVAATTMIESSIIIFCTELKFFIKQTKEQQPTNEIRRIEDKFKQHGNQFHRRFPVLSLCGRFCFHFDHNDRQLCARSKQAVYFPIAFFYFPSPGTHPSPLFLFPSSLRLFYILTNKPTTTTTKTEIKKKTREKKKGIIFWLLKKHLYISFHQFGLGSINGKVIYYRWSCSFGSDSIASNSRKPIISINKDTLHWR